MPEPLYRPGSVARTLLLACLVALPTACKQSSQTHDTAPVATTVSVSSPIIAQIRDEGLNRSQVMQTLDVLTNVIGPRLTNSPNQRRASAWAADQLTSWGLQNARLEHWGPFGRGWEVKRFSIQAVAPTQFAVIGYPRAWSPGLASPIESEVVHLDASNEAELEKYKGQLAGKVVLIGSIRKLEARFEPLASRNTDAELEKLGASAKALDTQVEGRRDTASERQARFRQSGRQGEVLTATRPATNPTAGPSTRAGRRGFNPFASKALAFAKDQGAALVVTSSNNGDGGTMFVQGASVPGEAAFGGSTTRPRIWSKEPPANIPQVTIATEEFNRLLRMIARGEKPKLAVDLQVAFHDEDLNPPNVIAEIPGTDPLLKDEIVMVGAHLDSWHSGTGTTDNGVGSSAALESVRILAALNLKPRRTIRVALWSGEEQGIYGSAAYVKKHFGEYAAPSPDDSSPTTDPARRRARVLTKAADYEKLSAYYNLDNGTGKIRGIYTQGNAAAAPLFAKWLKDFHDQGAKTVTLNNTSSTDHIPFDTVGLPGFQFIQDEIEYGTRTWHSNQDTYDRAQEADLKQASTIMAAFLWQTANMDDRFPRKPLTP